MEVEERKRRAEKNKIRARTEDRKTKDDGKHFKYIVVALLTLLVLHSCSYWVPPTYEYKVVHVGNDIQNNLEKYPGWELDEITGTIHSEREAVLRRKAWFLSRFF